MGKRKRFKSKVSIKEKLFMITNTLLVVIIISYYLYRLFFYKDYFESLQTSVDDDYLVTIIENSYKSMDSQEIDYNEESGIYSYHADAEGNYLSYSGRLFRILLIDEEKNIIAVSDRSESIFVLQDNSAFMENEINLWLNGNGEEHTGIYLNSLDNPEKNLIKKNSFSIVNNSDDIGAGVKTVYEYCSLLTLEDYQKFGGPASFLNSDETFWLASCDEQGNYWMVNKDGTVSLSKNKAQYAGIKTVICFNSQTMALAGDGKEDTPFLISNYNISTSRQLMIGQYVSISDYLFRVIENGDNGIRLILDDVIQDQYEQDYLCSYGTDYSYNVKSGIGKYLNSTFLKTIENYDKYLVKNNYYYGEFSPLGTYSYLQGYSNIVNCYVGLPLLGDMLLDGNKNYFLSNQSVSSDRIIFSINDNGIIYVDLLENQKAVKPVITINNSLVIEYGDGSMENPYMLKEPINE